MPKCLCLLISLLFLLPAYAQIPYSVKQADGSTKEVLLLPTYYKVDSTWIKLGTIKNEKGISPLFGDFKTQLDQLILAASAKGANIFILDKIKDRRQFEMYNISGNIYHTSQYENAKASFLAAKTKKYESNTCAYLIIYRPAYTNGYNDEVNFSVFINDTIDFEMKAQTKYVIKLTREGTYTLTAGSPETARPFSINIKFGNTYYARTFATFPASGKKVKNVPGVRFSGYNPYLLATDELQGELESSKVTQITLKKTL
jgi:hypothetical protein